MANTTAGSRLVGIYALASYGGQQAKEALAMVERTETWLLTQQLAQVIWLLKSALLSFANGLPTVVADGGGRAPR